MIDVELDDETIERARELYAAEITFMDEWVGRLMNRSRIRSCSTRRW